MTPEQLAALQAPNAVKNTSLELVKQFLFPQLPPLGLSPAGAFVEATGIMHGTGSGPGGTFTEDELKAMGVPADFSMYVQYTITGHEDANGPMLFDAADDIRIFQGYRGDTEPTPDPNYWYVDRVRTFFSENFQTPVSVADNAMLSIPLVRQTVEDVLMSAAETAGAGMPAEMIAHNAAPTDASNPAGPGPELIGIVYAGPAVQDTLDVMTQALGIQARGLAHVSLEPAKTLYVARVKDAATAEAILAKLKASPYGDYFSLAEFAPSDEHQEAAIRSGGAIPTLTA